jgi:predicted nucleic acid-binding protein
MKDIFLDTNVLIYACSDGDQDKHAAAGKLLTELTGNLLYVSVQVLNEFYSVMRRSGALHEDVVGLIEQFASKFVVRPLDLQIVRDSYRLIERYDFSNWDSLVIASALEANCQILYSEDLQDGQLIDNRLRIANPFL